MEKYYLAVDIGASSGRHILGTVKDKRISLEEIYRFENGMKRVDGHLCWDVKALFAEIVEGMKQCVRLGRIPVSMGIDTWAVDFVLLDGRGEVLGQSVGYRDDRTKGMDELVYEKITPEELYARTGIQKQIFNTVYQLMAIKTAHPEELYGAESMLMIPDYFHYLLTGVKKQEYTNATTTQLVSPVTNTWDRELIDLLGYPQRLFTELSMPGTVAGELSEKVAKEVGFSCKVALPATHDTGSAVMAVPVDQNAGTGAMAEPCARDTASGVQPVGAGTSGDILYISSGTWSLMGTELKEADCSMESMRANLTNEGGYDHRFRYLKNIMGLWMIQSVKKELAQAGENYSFAELCELASKVAISSIVDCNDDSFLAPESMILAVKQMCEKTGQDVPESVGEIAAVIYNSLAQCYGGTAKELEGITGKHYSAIHVVGGGANAEYLNELTAKYTKKTVYAGPSEATAIGNLLAQMIKEGEFAGLAEARMAVYESFEIKKYEPREQE